MIKSICPNVIKFDICDSSLGTHEFLNIIYLCENNNKSSLLFKQLLLMGNDCRDSNSTSDILKDTKKIGFDIISSYVLNSNDFTSESHDSGDIIIQYYESNNELIKSALFSITHMTGNESLNFKDKRRNSNSVVYCKNSDIYTRYIKAFIGRNNELTAIIQIKWKNLTVQLNLMLLTKP